MKKTVTLCINLILATFLSAQYQFEDNCLANRLKIKFPACISFDSETDVYILDTLCPAVLNAESLDLDGVATCHNLIPSDMQYFRNLKTLNVYWDALGDENPFYVPPTVINLDFEGINVLSPLDQMIAYPEGLEYLRFEGCKILNTGILPNKIKRLEFDHTNEMFFNDTMHIRNFPDSLEFLSIIDMNTAKLIYPDGDNAVKMDSFYVKSYELGYDPDVIANLPSSLKHIKLEWYEVDTIPALPESLQSLDISFPVTITLTIHSFPERLRSLRLVTNFNCLPPYPQSLEYLHIEPVGDFCHPNYIPNVGMGLNMCSDPYYNEIMWLNCPVEFKTITGNVYHDLNPNCEFNQATDLALSQVPVALYDENDNLVQKMYSHTDGAYIFSVPNGAYKVLIDTSECVLRKSCSSQLYASDIVVNDSNRHIVQNFELACDTLIIQDAGFDVSVLYMGQSRRAVPSFDFDLLTILGNGYYNGQLNCAVMDSALLDSAVQVETKVLGPVSFLEADSSLNISQSFLGDTLLLSFTIPMSEIPDFFDYNLRFLVDTTANAGDLIFVQTQITPPNGDLDMPNNSQVKIFPVFDSYDPNMKETHPAYIDPGFDDEIRYTIHFQNTGNSPAINVTLVDTLDQLLDLSTFRKVHSSHPVSTTLNGNRLQFRFTNIMLADSLSNPEGSKGYVEYAIRPKNPMQLDEKIYNTAYIYFDFNEPIVTNTSENWCTTFELNVAEETQPENKLLVYPNPLETERLLKIKKSANEEMKVSLFDLNGTEVGKYTLTSYQNEINLKEL
ncbi:MAG: hypothetical protein K0R65_2874, partial [Crocinitomicaceae bacterium]|nr:hypothetical protein [Crocinitomicaceae bacterium]